MYSFLLSVFIINQFVTLSLFSLACSSGYVYINAACYYLGSSLVTWYAANATCNSLGAGVHLATISSATEQDAIWAYYGSLFLWIGLNCIATHASSGTTGEVWVWADGSTSTYRNWRSGEPNNYDNNEACVEYAYYLWNDNNCANTHQYLCKYTPGMYERRCYTFNNLYLLDQDSI
jgi:mannose receptor, C type